MATYYKPSGSYSPMAFLLFVLACLIVIPILSTIYAYAIWYIPIPYVNFLVTGVFGFVVGLAVTILALKYGKVRNNTVATVLGILAGLWALYFHWAVWIDLVFHISESTQEGDMIAVSNANFGEVLGLAMNPSALFSIMSEINEFGTWGIKGGSVKGGFLTFIWIIEAIMIVGITVLSSSGQAGKPFCELNQKWYNEKELAATSLISNPKEFIESLSQGNASALEGITTEADPKTQNHSKFTLFGNETNENYLSLSNFVGTTNSKGELKMEEHIVASYLKVSEEIADKLEAIG